MTTKLSNGFCFFAFVLALAGVVLAAIENSPVEMLFHLTILVILGHYLFGDRYTHNIDNED